MSTRFKQSKIVAKFGKKLFFGQLDSERARERERESERERGDREKERERERET